MPGRSQGRNEVADQEELNQWLQRTSGEAAGVHISAASSDLLKSAVAAEDCDAAE